MLLVDVTGVIKLLKCSFVNLQSLMSLHAAVNTVLSHASGMLLTCTAASLAYMRETALVGIFYVEIVLSPDFYVQLGSLRDFKLPVIDW